MFSGGSCQIPKNSSATIGTMSNVGGSAGTYSASSPQLTVPQGTIAAGSSIPVTATAAPGYEGPTTITFSGPGLAGTTISCRVLNG